MEWPFVSRARFEALEDKYDTLEKHYKELQLCADKLLDSMLEHPAEKSEEEKAAERTPTPRRLTRRDISNKATEAAAERYRQSRNT